MGFWGAVFGTETYYREELEKLNMCGRPENKAPEKGSKWTILGDGYMVSATDQAYLAGNGGDPEARYISLAPLGLQKRAPTYVITHKQFAKLAEPWQETLVERYITIDQILRAEPCESGIATLCRILRLSLRDYGDSRYTMVKTLIKRGNLDEGRSIQGLYNEYVSIQGMEPPDAYLLFVAKALNLVPKNSTGPDRATLKRLLGIK